MVIRYLIQLINQDLSKYFNEKRNPNLFDFISGHICHCYQL